MDLYRKWKDNYYRQLSCSSEYTTIEQNYYLIDSVINPESFLQSSNFMRQVAQPNTALFISI